MKSERFIRLGISDILFFRFATISFSTAPMPNVMICASGTASHIPVSFQKNGRIGSIRRGVALKYELKATPHNCVFVLQRIFFANSAV